MLRCNDVCGEASVAGKVPAAHSPGAPRVRPRAAGRAARSSASEGCHARASSLSANQKQPNWRASKQPALKDHGPAAPHARAPPGPVPAAPERGGVERRARARGAQGRQRAVGRRRRAPAGLRRAVQRLRRRVGAALGGGVVHGGDRGGVAGERHVHLGPVGPRARGRAAHRARRGRLRLRPRRQAVPRLDVPGRLREPGLHRAPQGQGRRHEAVRRAALRVQRPRDDRGPRAALGFARRAPPRRSERLHLPLERRRGQRGRHPHGPALHGPAQGRGRRPNSSAFRRGRGLFPTRRRRS